MAITKDYIESAYHSVLAEVANIAAIREWKVSPKGLGYTNHKTKYGLATPVGEVLINQAFIGTTAYKKLDHVLRHEFAHLAVGLDKHHNRYFRRVERLFGVDLSLDLSEEQNQVIAKTNPAFKLIAHLQNGKEVDLGVAHRRTKKYTEYRHDQKGFMSIHGVRIHRFEYRDTE